MQSRDAGFDLAHAVALYRRDRRLGVSVPGTAAALLRVPCGVLSKQSQYVFSYDQAQDGPDAPEVALGLPFRHASYSSGDLFSIFAMNEPEGYLKAYLELAMQRIGIPDKLFFLLLSQGLAIGRVDYVHEHITLPDPGAEPLEALLHERSGSYFEHLLARFAMRSGISGAQPKVALHAQQIPVPTLSGYSKYQVATHDLIVKYAGDEFPGLSLNEFFCMTAVRLAGLATPRFWLSGDGTRFIIERFDRSGDGLPLGFEDMACLSATPAARKYEGSYEGILRITQRFCSDKARATQAMWARIAASALLKDGDAHLKNFGLLYEQPRARVWTAPAYDIVCTAIYPDLDRGLALKLARSRAFPTPENLMALANRFGIDRAFATRTLAAIANAIGETFDLCANDDRFIRDAHDTLGSLRRVIDPAAMRAC